jgi:hypothetical protein
MTLQEFKAWFEGFTENMSGTPNKDQWKRIRARVKEIDGIAITEKVFIDRYWRYPTYPYTNPNPWITFTNAGNVFSGLQSNAPLSTYATSNTAMYMLGQADSNSLNLT